MRSVHFKYVEQTTLNCILRTYFVRLESDDMKSLTFLTLNLQCLLTENLFNMLDLKFSQRWLWRLLSSGMLHHVVWYRLTDVSEESAASLFRLKTKRRQQTQQAASKASRDWKPASDIELERRPEGSNTSKEKSTFPENSSICQNEEMGEGGRKVVQINTRGCTWPRRVTEAVGSKLKIKWSLCSNTTSWRCMGEWRYSSTRCGILGGSRCGNICKERMGRSVP
jgi:hypothetical protein